MLIILHVLSALSSLAITTFAVLRPSRQSLRAGFALTTLTVASGSALIFTLHTRMLEACVSGLTYVGFALSGLLVAKFLLAREAVKVRSK